MSDITCYTIISQDRALLEWCVGNARERAGVDHDWLLVHWINAGMTDAAVRSIADAAQRLGMAYVPHTASAIGTHPTRTSWFLRNLYACWNLGYEHAKTKYVARLGSDQFFSRGWLAELLRASQMRDDHGIFHTWTVESREAQHSRHEIRDFGTDWQHFDATRFDQYADALRMRYSSRNILGVSECALHYRHPSRGSQLRPDGCTWFQTRELWERYGPLEDQINAEGVTGDVAYMDRLYDGGIPGHLVPPSVTYHLVRGESRDVYK